MLNRLLSPTPSGAKKIRNAFAIIATICGSIAATASTGGIALPASVITICTLITAISGGISVGAQTAKKNESK